MIAYLLRSVAQAVVVMLAVAETVHRRCGIRVAQIK